jgi:Major Facilitator Superfamily
MIQVPSSSASTTNTIGLFLIFLGRFLGGMGAANSTLGFTYIAEVIPHESMTKATSILSTVRIVGMALAPTLNMILNHVHYKIPVPTFLFGSNPDSDDNAMTIEINSLNSVGLVLWFGNLIALIVMYCTFHEPNPDEKNSIKLSSVSRHNNSNNNKDGGNTSTDDENNDETTTTVVDERSWIFWKSVLSIDIMIPIFIIFALNANFQLLETALAPAAADALQWGPIEVSSVFSFNAMLMFGVIVITYQLSSYGVSDMSFLLVGESISILGYTLLYILWKQDTKVWEFILPVVLSIICFPLLGAPARTVYTELVAAQPYLASHQGTMQALISMSASVAGFVAPGLIASYVLRSPSIVQNSTDQREFTPWALIAPCFSLLSFLGVLYLAYTRSHDKETTSSSDETTRIENDSTTDAIMISTNKNKGWKDDPVTCEEGKALLRQVGEVMTTTTTKKQHHSCQGYQPPKFCSKTIAYRKETCTLMGIHQISFMEHDAKQYNTTSISSSSGLGNGRNAIRQTVRF